MNQPVMAVGHCALLFAYHPCPGYRGRHRHLAPDGGVRFYRRVCHGRVSVSVSAFLRRHGLANSIYVDANHQGILSVGGVSYL